MLAVMKMKVGEVAGVAGDVLVGGGWRGAGAAAVGIKEIVVELV